MKCGYLLIEILSDNILSENEIKNKQSLALRKVLMLMRSLAQSMQELNYKPKQKIMTKLLRVVADALDDVADLYEPKGGWVCSQTC